VTNVNFSDSRFWQLWEEGPNDELFDGIFKFVECLGICHTIIAEQKVEKG
jgi:hypothetical protein